MNKPKWFREGWYILDADDNVVPVDDLLAWARWMENNPNARIIDHTQINSKVCVSTVFLGLDHQYGNGPPLLFETMIFGGKHDDYQWRYSSLDDAKTGHAVAVRKAREAAGQKVK